MLLKDCYYSCKYFFQKLFRSNHLSDSEIMNTHLSILRSIEKRLRAFMRIKDLGVPLAVKDIEEWNRILREILFAVTYYALDENFHTKKGRKFLKEYNYEDPYKEIPENKRTLTINEDSDSPSTSVYYCNQTLIEAMNLRAIEGLELFRKHLMDLWN